MTISIVMPVYNGIGFIEKSLPPLSKMLNDSEVIELIVIDDGSSDDSMALAKEFGAKVLESGGRKGPGAARNIAVEQAKGEIVWFVDADVVVRSDALIELKKGFDNEEVVAVLVHTMIALQPRTFYLSIKIWSTIIIISKRAGMLQPFGQGVERSGERCF